MRNYAPWLGAVALLTVCASARAQMKDAAELLPAQTLACVELRQPARLSREVAALVKGSSLEDLPRRLAKKHGEREGDMNFRYTWQREMLAMLGMFLSPEMLDEATRIRGGFIALTGFAKDGTPEVVGVLQSGGSNFPGMYMRAFLSFSRPHLVGEIEGVPLFRDVSYVYVSKPVPAGAAPEMEQRESGPVMAQVPGLLLFGSSVDSLKEVIRRAKGKSADVALASVRAFKDAAAPRDRPGLFVYVDMAALEAQLNEHTREVGHPLGRSWAILKTILGKETARHLTASLTLFNGNLQWQMRANLNGTTDSPLLGLLPDTAARRELLHFAPKDALLALAGGLGEGEKRWKTLLNLLDALDRFGGHGEANRPSKMIGELEEKLNLHIGKDVAAQLSGAGLVVHPEWGGDPNRWTLLLRAVDANAADKLEKHGLPRLLSLGSADVRPAVEEEVQGQRIKTVPNKGGAPSLHYGRRGSVFAIGPDRDLVAASLAAGGKKEGLLGETKTAEAVKEIDERAVMVSVVSPAQIAVDLFVLMRQTVARKEMQMKKIAVAPGGAPAAPPPPPQPPKESAEEAKIKQELRKAFEPLPPLTFSLNRQPDVLLLEMRPVALRRIAPRLLDVWIESLVKGMSQEAGVGGAAVPALPAAKTPAPPAKR
jgi:hypothetical protein